MPLKLQPAVLRIIRNPFFYFLKKIGYQDYAIHLQTDCYIISYPKCGRTWLRVLIGKALCTKFNIPENLLLKTYDLTARAGILRTQMGHDGAPLKTGISYHLLRFNKRAFRRKKVIFLIRDIKDVLVSSYFQATKRINKFDGNISDFIRRDEYGVKKIVTFYNIWHENRNIPREFMLLRYEDMQSNTEDALSKVLKFLGAGDVEKSIVEKAVSYASFSNMKQMEKNKSFGKYNILTPKNENDDESYKVRRGVIGGYKDYLSDDDINYIDNMISEMGCPFNNSYTGKNSV